LPQYYWSVDLYQDNFTPSIKQRTKGVQTVKTKAVLMLLDWEQQACYLKSAMCVCTKWCYVQCCLHTAPLSYSPQFFNRIMKTRDHPVCVLPTDYTHDETRHSLLAFGDESNKYVSKASDQEWNQQWDKTATQLIHHIGC